MRIVCWQTILVKYHILFFSKIRKDVEKFVVCCSRDWRFKGHAPIEQTNRCLSLPLSLEQEKLMGCEGTHKLYPAVEYAQKYLVKWALRISPEQRICLLPLKKIFTWVILANLQPHRLGW